MFQLIDAVDAAARFLDPAHVGIFCPEALDDGHADFDAAAARDRIKNDRSIRRLGDGAEVAEQALGAGFVVVGRDDEHGVGTGFMGKFGEFDRFVGRVGAGAGDHGHATGGSRDYGANDVEVLLVGKRGRFSSGTNRN